jgi:hypothetical protein
VGTLIAAINRAQAVFEFNVDGTIVTASKSLRARWARACGN